MNCYEYVVCWRNHNCNFWEWKHKGFAQKKEAQRFAHKMKKRGEKPYPYILRKITTTSVFRDDIRKVELAPDRITFQEQIAGKFIKY